MEGGRDFCRGSLYLCQFRSTDSNTYYQAVPWLRRLLAGLSPRRPEFHPGSDHVVFVVDKVALGQVFPPSASVFPCQLYSTGTSLDGKRKNTNHLHHRVAQ